MVTTAHMSVVLDHLAVAATTLEEGTAWVEDRLGVQLQQGGKHARYGTHNTLLGLADGIYLEVIAVDPDAVPEAEHRWFGLDNFSGPPRLANWICQTNVFAQAPAVAGPAVPLTRGDLAWQITVPFDGSLPMGGGFPTLIKWGAGVAHPSSRLADVGCKLRHLDVTHPRADEIAQIIEIADSRVTLHKGAFDLTATFQTPHGPRTL